MAKLTNQGRRVFGQVSGTNVDEVIQVDTFGRLVVTI